MSADDHGVLIEIRERVEDRDPAELYPGASNGTQDQDGQDRGRSPRIKGKGVACQHNRLCNLGGGLGDY